MESFSDDDLVKMWNALARKDDWIDECEMCRMPCMLHKGPCTRKEELNDAEALEAMKAWSVFKAKMKPILQWQENEEQKTRIQSDLLGGIREIVDLRIKTGVKFHSKFCLLPLH